VPKINKLSKRIGSKKTKARISKNKSAMDVLFEDARERK